MALVFLEVRKDGCARWVQYLCRRKGDDADRPVEDRVGSIYWSMPLPFLRSQALVMGRLLDGTCESKRAKKLYKNLVFSCEDAQDPAVYEENLGKAKAAAMQFVQKFAPHSEYILIAHQEKDHAHVHLVLSNWDKDTKRTLDWPNNQVLYMQGFDWCTVPGVVPGAYLYAERQSTSYPKGRKELQLVEIIEGSSIRAAETIQNLVDSRGADPYEFKGHPGIVFRGARIQLRALNHQLRKKRLKQGVARVDGRYVSIAHEEPFYGPVEQQNRIYNRMGVGTRMSLEDFGKFIFDPLFDSREMSESQRAALHDLQAGRQPKDESIMILLGKHIAAHQRRAIEYDGAERAADPQYVRAQYHRDPGKDPKKKSPDRVIWDRQPYWVWCISRDLSRANARLMGPCLEKYMALADWLESIIMSPSQPPDQPL